MMQKVLKPYREYRDSGLPWIGRIPRHWDLIPNRAFLRLKKDTVGSQNVRHTLLSLTLAGVVPRDLDNPKGKFPASFDSYQTVGPGDLVFCLFDIDETPRAVGMATEPGMVTGAYTVFSCADKHVREYILSLYLHLDEQKSLKPLYTGLRKVIKKNTFLGLKSPMPPAEERAHIVRFVTHTSKKIDRLIRAKQRLIALLNEQKQAIIQRAVTRGLDPDVRLKLSRVEWLGGVPEGWKTLRTKYVADLNPGKREIAGLPDDELASFLPMEAVGEWGDLDLSRSIKLREGKSGYTYMREGDVLIAKITPCFENGKGAVCRGLRGGIGFGSTEFHVLRAARDISPEFLYYVTRSSGYRLLGEQVMEGAGGQKRVPAHFLANTELPVPPLQEQAAIVTYLDRALSRLDAVSKRVQKEIALIREYRTRLIADVVTGKVDMRGVGVPDAEDPEVLFEADVPGEEDELAMQEAM